MGRYYDKLKVDFESRVDVLLNNISLGVYSGSDILRLRLAVEDFKNILTEIKKLK